MKINILYISVWIYYFFMFNIIKLTCLIIIILSSIFLYKYQLPDSIEKTKIVNQTKIEEYYVYTYKEIKENKVEFNNLTYENPQKVVNNYLITKSYNAINILVWSLLIISFFTFLIVGFLNDWFDLHQSFRETAFKFIKMEFEDEFYHYTLFDKLLIKSKKNLNKSEVKGLLYNYDGLLDLKFQPTFISKTEIRERKLNTLFQK
jgi:hypothetical protein